MPTEPKPNRHLVRLTFILTGLGAVASELALTGPGKSLVGGVLVASLLTAWSGGAFAFLVYRAKGEAVPSLTTVATASVLLGTIWLVNVGRAVVLGDGLPYELWLVLCLRDAGLCLAALCGIPVCLRITGGVSVALVLFSACLAEHKLIYVILAAYAVLGSYWLILLYWSLLQLKLLQGRSQRLPVLSVIVVGFLICAVTVLAVGPKRTATSLAELLGSSGGSQRKDRDARSGVGDGDNLARAKNTPQSTGPVETDIFLESTERSLYDASNDKWGEPKKNKEQLQAKAITNESQGDLHEKSEQSRPTREFSVVRHPPDEQAAPPRRLADAALYVTGKTPLHLRLLAFDQFDGVTWLEPKARVADCGLVRGLGGWLYLPESDASIFAGSVAHKITVGTLDATQLMLPPHRVGFRLGDIDLPHLFGWSQEGILCLKSGKVPRQTVIESESRTVAPDLLGSVKFKDAVFYAMPHYLALPGQRGEDTDAEGRSRMAKGLDPRIAALARDWVASVETGWPQVEAVVTNLRRYCTYDRSSTAPEDCDDAVAYFLFDARRGDDYAFASSACVLLRMLGFPTRFVQGFYADPKRYDAELGQTPVGWRDLHTWAEVFLPTHEWVVLEPTPGYRVLGPENSLTARAWAAVRAWFGRLAAHPLLLLGLLILVSGLFRFRREILDGLSTARWKLLARVPSRARVIATLSLLERRCKLGGHARPRGKTLRSWYKTVAHDTAFERQRPLLQFIELAEWAEYAPPSFLEPDSRCDGDIQQCCREVIRIWTLAEFRAACNQEKALANGSRSARSAAVDHA